MHFVLSAAFCRMRSKKKKQERCYEIEISEMSFFKALYYMNLNSWAHSCVSYFDGLKSFVLNFYILKNYLTSVLMRIFNVLLSRNIGTWCIPSFILIALINFYYNAFYSLIYKYFHVGKIVVHFAEWIFNEQSCPIAVYCFYFS